MSASMADSSGLRQRKHWFRCEATIVDTVISGSNLSPLQQGSSFDMTSILTSLSSW